MFSNAHKCVLGAIAAAGLSFGSVPAEASFLVISHNGSVGSTPPGSGVVPVTMTCTHFTPTIGGFPEPGEDCTKDWTAFPSQPHVIQWQGPTGTLREVITNNTGIPWTDYHWEFVPIADVEIALDNNLGLVFDLFGGPNGGLGLSLIFDDPIPNMGSFEATIGFNFELADDTVMEIYQYPTIPEPTTLALMGLGLAGIGYQRRRKASL